MVMMLRMITISSVRIVERKYRNMTFIITTGFVNTAGG